MRLAFFVSSIGDTDLAKATIAKIREQSCHEIFIIPLTTTAIDRTKDLKNTEMVSIISIEEITKEAGLLLKDTITEQQVEAIKSFLEEKSVQHAYFGVPSSNNEMPYQIARQLTIPFTLAYEYMFKPEKHALWKYVEELTAMQNGRITVPLHSAISDIQTLNRQANIEVIGHLSLDRENDSTTDISKTKMNLSVDLQQELIFISGTTQPIAIDNNFLDALLSELATEKYPSIQLRMGIHPGVKDIDTYLATLLETAKNYPGTQHQFKLIVTAQLASKMKQPIAHSPFIIRADVAGSDAAQAAEKVTQAVPGALLNEAALKGKPSYFHDKTAKPYLPETWFSGSIPVFFSAKSQAPHAKSELGLVETAPSSLSKLLTQ